MWAIRESPLRIFTLHARLCRSCKVCAGKVNDLDDYWRKCASAMRLRCSESLVSHLDAYPDSPRTRSFAERLFYPCWYKLNKPSFCRGRRPRRSASQITRPDVFRRVRRPRRTVLQQQLLVGTGVLDCPRPRLRARASPIWHGEFPQSRPLGVREVQTIEYRLYRTIEPKQRGAGARVSSDARRVCDASGQEEGVPVAQRNGEEGVAR